MESAYRQMLNHIKDFPKRVVTSLFVQISLKTVASHSHDDLII